MTLGVQFPMAIMIFYSVSNLRLAIVYSLETPLYPKDVDHNDHTTIQ